MGMTVKNRFVQAYRQTPWRLQVQWIVLFLVVLLLIASVAGVYLSISSRAATYGREIQYMQSQIDAQKRSIANMESQLAFLTSTSQMNKRALAMGFQVLDPKNETYIVIPGFTARDTAQLAPQPGSIEIQPPLIKPSYTESLWDWFAHVVSSAVQNNAQGVK
jgi:hypothetical protein